MSRSQSCDGAAREAVREVYDGPEGELFSLVMGEQVHLGGLEASRALAEAAGIRGGRGVDLCCCNGAGMRFLVRFQEVVSMIGIDLAQSVVDLGRDRCLLDGSASQIEFRCGDACASDLADESADFVWSEDAWCYVPNKDRLIAEAARIVREGGVIAFSDWVEGPAGMSSGERDFLCASMKFDNLETMDGYRNLLETEGCEVVLVEDTGLYAPQMALFAEMLAKQLRWDALRLLDFDEGKVDAVIQGFRVLSDWGVDGKIAQARFVARR